LLRLLLKLRSGRRRRSDRSWHEVTMIDTWFNDRGGCCRWQSHLLEHRRRRRSVQVGVAVGARRAIAAASFKKTQIIQPPFTIILFSWFRLRRLTPVVGQPVSLPRGCRQADSRDSGPTVVVPEASTASGWCGRDRTDNRHRPRRPPGVAPPERIHLPHARRNRTSYGQRTMPWLDA
jgi:hypothetical protein